jgi:hypothetical protein
MPRPVKVKSSASTSVDFENLGRLRRDLDAFWQPRLASLKDAAESSARRDAQTDVGEPAARRQRRRS